MSEKFTVTIPVKPYVKRFIETNYGLPADFSKYPELNKEVRRCLKKPETRYDNRFNIRKMATYTETLQILISQDDFYRHGWEFSKTDVVSFGKIFEIHIKKLMKNTVCVYRGLGLSIKESILKFQECYMLDEEYWSYDSIKKEFYRNRPDTEVDFFPSIISKINELFSGDIVPQKGQCHSLKLQHYEND